MEEDEANLRIVESLRGRLLAERAASKAAKLDEHLMDSKLKELEGQLRRETKARKRFEKKLTSLKNKLQSLKLPHMLDHDLEESSDSSCISSIASTEQPLPSDQTSETHSDESHTFQACPSQESASSDTDSSRPKHEMEDGNGDSTSTSQEEESEVDNSMALVPFLSLPEEQQETKEVVKISNESVREVLGTLQHIREEIQRTMQRRQATRQMIQVG